jgi:hypothetical protein
MKVLYVLDRDNFGFVPPQKKSKKHSYAKLVRCTENASTDTHAAHWVSGQGWLFRKQLWYAESVVTELINYLDKGYIVVYVNKFQWLEENPKVTPLQS